MGGAGVNADFHLIFAVHPGAGRHLPLVIHGGDVGQGHGGAVGRAQALIQQGIDVAVGAFGIFQHDAVFVAALDHGGRFHAGQGVIDLRRH